MLTLHTIIMEQIKIWMLTAILTICGLTMLTSCSDEDDDVIIPPPLF